MPENVRSGEREKKCSGFKAIQHKQGDISLNGNYYCYLLLTNCYCCVKQLLTNITMESPDKNGCNFLQRTNLNNLVEV